MSWTNDDGLQVLIHGEQGEVKTNGGTNKSYRETLVVELLDATVLHDTAVTVAANDAFIPDNAVITNSWLIVEAAFTTGDSAVLDIGLYDAAGSAIAAVGGDDAIDAGVAAGALTLNAVIANDGDGVSARMSEKAYVGFTSDTGDFTAGAAKLIIEYIVT